jgi:kinesin family protein 15
MDNIKVFIRVKPETNSNLPGIIKVQDEKSLIIETANKSDIFSFDFVGETDQEQVFKSVGKVITDNCLKGYNGTIFAYGQTGSGKTYSMQGPSTSNGDLIYEERGIIPRCFEYLFKMIERTEDRSYLCRASYYEIYNEFVYDLLDPISPCCLVREDMTKGVYVDGLTEENVHSAEHTYELLKTGARNRHVAETSMNRESSRSHSVFTLVIQSKSCDVETGNVITQESRFNLVDLAGSERQKLTSASIFVFLNFSWCSSKGSWKYQQIPFCSRKCY